jgi:hypothetical protein
MTVGKLAAMKKADLENVFHALTVSVVTPLGYLRLVYDFLSFEKIQ